MKNWRVLTVGLLAGSLALAGCGKEGAPGSTGPVVSEPVAANVQVAGSPTFDKIAQRGRVVIGVKDDQPGLGFKDATTGEFSGFDV